VNVQSKLIISLILVLLIFWLLKNFSSRKLGSGQTLFWLVLLFGAELFTLFPSLVDRVSVLWGNLVPVSWITFAGLVFLIYYLLGQTIQVNRLQSQLVHLARTIAFLEMRMRRAESRAEHRSEASASSGE
jgi:hypothetical protein